MTNRHALTWKFFFLLISAFGFIGQCLAVNEPQLEQDSRAALAKLYDGSPGAKSLGQTAKGILIFPHIVKAGLVVGGQGGDGVLFINDKPAGYYNTSALSIGLQAGAQSFGYVLFFMSDAVLNEFKQSKNFQIGVGPNVVILDAGAAKDISTLTTKADVYAVIFSQKGLMAGIGLQGSKITKLN
ncbi:MAG TPA: YSC84-related protein [Burkholderiales bacterium]|nr:YSC84-related protein [Burkholderiales bacterium]